MHGNLQFSCKAATNNYRSISSGLVGTSQNICNGIPPYSCGLCQKSSYVFICTRLTCNQHVEYTAVITYVDRQLTSRRLLDPDHESLLQTLHEIQDEGLADIHDALMETLPKRQQFTISSQTDVR
jgi:hypothetical protein